MKQLLIIGSLVLVFIFSISAFILFEPFTSKEEVDATDQKPVPTQTINTTLPSGSEKIEVFAFHATQRCISCINIGKYTQEVINQKFASEIYSGKIVFKEINIDLPENKQMAKDYGVSGSALFINAIKDGKDNHEEDATVWRLVTNEAQLKTYFEAKLKKLL